MTTVAPSLFRPRSRFVCGLLPTIAMLLAFTASAATQDAAPTVDNPNAQAFADVFEKGCREDFLTRVPQSIRDDAGKDASPALIEDMTAVVSEGMCGCFVATLRKQPDDRVGATLVDSLKPEFMACLAKALKPRMARICTESQRMPKDDSAPDCACLATRTATIEDASLGAVADDLFDVLNSTRDIPASAGPLGEAARACAAAPGH